MVFGCGSWVEGGEIGFGGSALAVVVICNGDGDNNGNVSAVFKGLPLEPNNARALGGFAFRGGILAGLIGIVEAHRRGKRTVDFAGDPKWSGFARACSACRRLCMRNINCRGEIHDDEFFSRDWQVECVICPAHRFAVFTRFVLRVRGQDYVGVW